MRPLAIGSLGLLLLAAIQARAQQPDAAEALPSVALPPGLERVLRDYERAWQARDGQWLIAADIDNSIQRPPQAAGPPG